MLMAEWEEAQPRASQRRGQVAGFFLLVEKARGQRGGEGGNGSLVEAWKEREWPPGPGASLLPFPWC